MTIEQAIEKLTPLVTKENEIAANLQRLNTVELAVCDQFWSLDRPFIADSIKDTQYIWQDLKYNKNKVKAYCEKMIVGNLDQKHFNAVYTIVKRIDNIKDMVCPECGFWLNNDEIWLSGDLPAISAVECIQFILNNNKSLP